MMSNTLRLFKRTYTVAAEGVKGLTAAASSSVIRREAKKLTREDGAGGGEAVKRDVFWMRDPRTGNWIPETHFHEIDIAELRNKLLPCKPEF
nr:protein SENESCENCE-ASSOCIATED GENE 21, mitochondrial-like [Ipomoea batatas]